MPGDKGIARRLWLGLLVAGVAAGVGPQAVEAEPFNITQVTKTTAGFNDDPAINAAGTRIAFESSSDLTPGSPGNADGNFEIFLFDTATGLFTQVTNTTGGDSFFPAINAAGTRIAFVSDRDLTPGSPGNADGNTEIFLFDTTTALFTQVTNTTGGCSNDDPAFNAAGTRIAFVSDCDLTPGSPGNADGNTEIFLFDTATALFTQVTNTTGGANRDPAINAAGTRIAFTSNRDLTPGSPGNADGNFEIFLFDTATAVFTQVTNTTGGGNSEPALNAAGTRIAFISDRDLTPGSPGNADGNLEIFLFDTVTAVFTQVTNTTGASISTRPTINADGTRIAFHSNHDLTPGSPGNADGNVEIFLFDTATGLFTQITNTTGGFNVNAVINADGTRIAFRSNRDLTPGSPGNADGNNEIFLASTTSPSQAVPTLSHWMQLVMVGCLLLGAFLALRRRANRAASVGTFS